MDQLLLQQLERHQLLKDVPKPQLEWLVQEGEVQEFPSGQLFKVGSMIDNMLIILEGRVRSFRVQNNQQVEIATWGPETITGALPFSRMKESPVDTEVIEPMKVLALHKSKFRSMICTNPDLTEVFVHVLTDRVRMFTSLHFQNEKLMALGKLSAGLAHELNNPASAIVRGAGSLRDHLASLLNGAGTLTRADIPEEALDGIAKIVTGLLDRKLTSLSVLERSRREDELSDWLEDVGVDQPSEVAADLVELGLTPEELTPLSTAIPQVSCTAAVNWLRLALNSSRNVLEIEEAARRISALISSVKTYTRLDQVQATQNVDINDGIRNTLMILQHKSRHNSVNVIEELQHDLPAVRGYPGEFNQVWTNVIDNALDAMEKGGNLTVKSYEDHGRVMVDVIDSGTGIPQDVLGRIFDPFFTTKEIGRGSGVGLDVVQQIIRRHAGTISVESRPGKTVFSFCLPVTKE